MDYDPSAHVPTARTIAAAWLLCLGMAALGVGIAARHPAAGRLPGRASTVLIAQHSAAVPATEIPPGARL